MKLWEGEVPTLGRVVMRGDGYFLEGYRCDAHYLTMIHLARQLRELQAAAREVVADGAGHTYRSPGGPVRCGVRAGAIESLAALLPPPAEGAKGGG
jgi:hypothetical protein